LSKVEGVKKCTRGSYEAHRGLAVGEIKVNDESQQDATDVVVFLPTDTRKGGHTIGEHADIIVWGKTSATGIDLVGSIGSFDPVEQILEDTLIKLVEDIRGYRAVDMDKRETTPEWMKHRLDAQLQAQLDKESQVEVVGVGECF
jgi:hypothetical protein